MNENAVMERASMRCFACKLPTDVLNALHADRFERGMGFEALARKYALPDRPLSESGCRRHFARHVAAPADSVISEGEADLPGVATDDLDGHAVLEASTKALTEMMDSLVRQHRDVVARNPREAERLLGVFMKVQSALARSLKQRDEGQARRQEFAKAIPPIVQRCTSAAMHALLPLMRANAKRIRDEVVEYANGRLGAEEFSKRLFHYETAWPQTLAETMRAAQTEALKAEEAKVQG